MKPKLAIGFIIYGQSSAKYLEQFLPSLLQAVANCGLEVLIMAYDNGPEGYADNHQLLSNYPQVTILGSGHNLGFAQSNNVMIDLAIESGANYFLTINPDTLLDVNALTQLVQTLELNQALGSASPKLLRWDFAGDAKTKSLDSCGIVLNKGLQFRDLGQGEEDHGQYDQAEILGPSGAAAIYRLSALAQVKNQHGYFDNRFFMYKEDCDLAYSLHQAGFASCLVASAIIYHDRSAANQDFSLLGRLRNMRTKSVQVQAWSYFGDWLIFFKHFSSLNLSDKLAALFYRSLSLSYALVFNRKLLSEINQARSLVYKK